jgi:hypothetical protein
MLVLHGLRFMNAIIQQVNGAEEIGSLLSHRVDKIGQQAIGGTVGGWILFCDGQIPKHIRLELDNGCGAIDPVKR